jgi:hypothetical protein
MRLSSDCLTHRGMGLRHRVARKAFTTSARTRPAPGVCLARTAPHIKCRPLGKSHALRTNGGRTATRTVPC